ncbi:outer membrane beta-barrel protein [Porphyromonas crevioricanis]|nr:outer membrane beta-barrel protein [Porphyromonas crevioricanis]
MNKPIKLKLTALLLSFLGACTLSAQSIVGFKAGVGVYSFPNKDVKSVAGVSARLGASYAYAFMPENTIQPVLQGELALSSVGAEVQMATTSVTSDPTNNVSFRGTFLNLPLSAGVRFNLEGRSALTLRAGCFFDFGLWGNKKVETNLSDKTLYVDMFKAVFFDDNRGLKSQVLDFRKVMGGLLFALDYTANEHLNFSLEAQKQGLIEKAGIIYTSTIKQKLNPMNITFSIGYNF